MVTKIEVKIPSSVQDVADTALLRLGGSLPNIEFSISKEIITAVTHDDVSPDEIRKHVLNSIYRESIFQRTISIREKILG